ncbi:hypothetical protein [Blastomonas sp.]|uniref:hypothetical protein n=1 Tax=Blastomonas sp. TaxID=1909299 RepID=UPI0035940C6E
MSDRLITLNGMDEAQFLPVWDVQQASSSFRPSPLFSAMSAFVGNRDATAPQEDADNVAFDDLPLEDDTPDIEAQIADAYRIGHADGVEQARAEQQASDAATLALASAITALRPQLSESLCAMLLGAMKAMLERSSGFTAPDAAVLERHVASLAALVTKDMRGAALHVHPADLELLGDAECGLVLTPDTSLRRGTVSLNHADGWIEQGTQPMLDALQGLIDDMESGQ